MRRVNYLRTTILALLSARSTCATSSLTGSVTSATPATWVSAMQTVKSYCFATPTICFPTTGVSQGIESLKERQVVSGSGIYFLEGTFKNFWALGKAYETIHPATETETYTPVNADRAIPILMGCSFAARRSALISRGFDVNAPWGSEDNELALYLREHGIETETSQVCVSLYRGRDPKTKSRRKAEFKSARAHVWLARKYHLTSQLPATRRGAWLLNPLRLPLVAAKMALVPSSRDWNSLRSRFNATAGLLWACLASTTQPLTVRA